MPIDAIELMADCGVTRDAVWFMDGRELHRHAMSRRTQTQGQQVLGAGVNTSSGVTVIPVHGVMVNDARFEDEVSMPQLEAALLSAASDPEVSAVVLDIDTPGGAAFGALELRAAAAKVAAAKPLLAHVSDLCCSGGYFLASAATKIFARQRTTIGSIGTRILIYDYSKLFEQEGIEAVAIDTGEFKTMGALGTQLTENHRAHLQHLVDQYQQDFSNAVSDGRGLTGDALAAVSDGRVFLAEEAETLGLVDGIQTLDETIAMATATTLPQPKATTMAETTKQEPVTATLAELKENLPGATSDFVLDQLSAGATIQQAMKAHLAVLQGEKEQADKQTAEALERAEKAEASKVETPEPGKKRGNAAPESNANQEDAGDTDYRAMAVEVMEKKNCRWSEACLHVKRRHPESRSCFGAPPA